MDKKHAKDDTLIFKDRTFFVTVQGVNTIQATYQWRDVSNQIFTFLITLSAFPGWTVGRIAVFSRDLSQWSFLRDWHGQELEVNDLAKKKAEDIGTWTGKIFTFEKDALRKIIVDEEKLLTYAKMLYGG